MRGHLLSIMGCGYVRHVRIYYRLQRAQRANTKQKGGPYLAPPRKPCAPSAAVVLRRPSSYRAASLVHLACWAACGLQPAVRVVRGVACGVWCKTRQPLRFKQNSTDCLSHIATRYRIPGADTPGAESIDIRHPTSTSDRDSLETHICSTQQQQQRRSGCTAVSCTARTWPFIINTASARLYGLRYAMNDAPWQILEPAQQRHLAPT